MIAHLEKIEGKSSSFNFPNDSIPQLDSQGFYLGEPFLLPCRYY
jgi:hypothetical protein